MKKLKNIIIYTMIFIFVFQNTFFDISLASNNEVKVLDAIAGSCLSHWIWYSFDGNNCVCDNPSQGGECEVGFMKNIHWCCIKSCGVCSSNSVEFQKYINFQVELYGLLLNEVSEGKDNKKSIGFTQRGIFSSRVLSIPINMRKSFTKMFKRVGQEYVDTWNAAKIWSIIVTSIIVESRKDFFGGIMILFKSKPFIRERETIQDLDSVAYDLMRDFSKKWLRSKDVSSDFKKNIEILIKGYLKTEENQRWMFEKFYFQWNIKYKDLLNISRKINSLMKNFLLTWKEWISFMTSFEKEFSKWNIVVQFSEDRKNNILYDYACARKMNACKEDISNLISVGGVKKSFTESMSIIKKANKSLLDIYTDKKERMDDKSNPFGLTEKQVDLLRTVYGVDTTKITKGEGIGVLNFFDKSSQTYNKTKNWINLKVSDYATRKEERRKKKEEEEERRDEQDENSIKNLTEEEQNEIKETLKDEVEKIAQGNVELNLPYIIETVLNEKESDKNIVLFYNTNSTNRHFKEVVEFIQYIIKEDIWKKDTNGLVQYLWEACVAQCTNKWTKNCFK